MSRRVAKFSGVAQQLPLPLAGEGRVRARAIAIAGVCVDSVRG
ncbi:hypothetical protein [Lysobacter gummosus]